MRKVIKITFVLIIVFALITTTLSVSILLCLMEKKNIEVDEDLLKLPDENAKTILYYYDDGNEVPQIFTDSLSSGSAKYKYVPISNIPQDMINAFVAIEDKRFFEHSGVDFARSMRAVVNYVLKKSNSFGASTITQQVVKNVTGRNERTPKRKINEIFMALNLEKKYSKSEILEIYMNVINLSDGCTGVGAASEYYFSKCVSELTLAEIATIASITNNPTLYNPRLHAENTVQRRNIVLKCMYEQGYISLEEYKATVGLDLKLNLNMDLYKNSGNSWFTETVIADLVDDFTDCGYTKSYAYNQIYHGGLKVYTTVNPSIQKLLEDYYENLDVKMKTVNKESPQSAMIIVDPYNGDVLGVVGATGKKKGELIQNYATDTLRPPGSAIKPISVYAPLIDSGDIIWSTIAEDSPVSYSGGRAWPQNANRKYIGNTDIADALANSTNTVAVKMLYKLGAGNSLHFLKEKLKIKSLVSKSKDSDGDRNAVSLALGQTVYGISLRELVSAYSIFEEGNMSTSRTYYKVEDSNGNVIFDKRNNQEKVIEYETASLMTKLLEGVVKNGTASGKISLANRVAVAGKTGTTQGNCDRLFVGYTPNFLAGVWCGYDYPEAIPYELANPSITIWNEVMSKIYDLEEYQNLPCDFAYSAKIKMLTYNKTSGELHSQRDNPNDLKDGWFVTE